MALSLAARKRAMRAMCGYALHLIEVNQDSVEAGGSGIDTSVF
jgi:hypothetical protein